MPTQVNAPDEGSFKSQKLRRVDQRLPRVMSVDSARDGEALITSIQPGRRKCQGTGREGAPTGHHSALIDKPAELLEYFPERIRIFFNHAPRLFGARIVSGTWGLLKRKRIAGHGRMVSLPGRSEA